MTQTLLTGDRPTGRLHLGHFVGSIQNRIKLQDEVDQAFYMIADVQALTDNADNPDKVRSNVLEIALDNLACGIDPSKTTMFIQSQVPEIAELTVFFMNLVTVQQLSHNPTIKSESAEKGFNLVTKLVESDEETSGAKGIPLGFLAYPVSQTADILAFKANTIPVGQDQMPVIEQANDIVKKFNSMYGVELFSKINGVVGDIARLVGTDGNAKMSKSLGNCIYLSDSDKAIEEKVMSMYTDPDHVRVEDPGKVEGNVVFTYLDIFDPNKEEVAELKTQYQKGGLGDVVIKKRLVEVLKKLITPIREKREELAQNPEQVMATLKKGTEKARAFSAKTLEEVKSALKIDYFV
jgi:tryptophanyl-tRNA synthetase